MPLAEAGLVCICYALGNLVRPGPPEWLGGIVEPQAAFQTRGTLQG